jgi:hypothetical protein
LLLVEERKSTKNSSIHLGWRHYAFGF